MQWLLMHEKDKQTCPVCRNVGTTEDRVSIPLGLTALLKAYFNGSVEPIPTSYSTGEDTVSAARMAAQIQALQAQHAQEQALAAQRVVVQFPAARTVTMPSDNHVRSNGEQGSMVAVRLFDLSVQGQTMHYNKCFGPLMAYRSKAQSDIVHLREYNNVGRFMDYVVNPLTGNAVLLNGAQAKKILQDCYDISRSRLETLIAGQR